MFCADDGIYEQICKPGSVFDSHLSKRAVAGALQPPRERTGRPIAPIPVLLRIEFTATVAFTRRRVSSYLAFPPLPHRRKADGRYISVALFLKSPSAGVTRYPCPVEPGLSSWTGFRPVPATIQRTRRINSIQTAAESQRKFTERGGSAAFYPVPFPPPTGSPRESAPRRCGTALPHPTESLPAPDAA